MCSAVILLWSLSKVRTTFLDCKCAILCSKCTCNTSAALLDTSVLLITGCARDLVGFKCLNKKKLLCSEPAHEHFAAPLSEEDNYELDPRARSVLFECSTNDRRLCVLLLGCYIAVLYNFVTMHTTDTGFLVNIASCVHREIYCPFGTFDTATQ